MDLAVLQEISLDNDIELGHHRQVTPDLQHTHPTHQEDNTSFDRSNGQLDNSNRGRDKQDAEQQVAVPIHRTEGGTAATKSICLHVLCTVCATCVEKAKYWFQPVLKGHYCHTKKRAGIIAISVT